jgi:hypothetical protein
MAVYVRLPGGSGYEPLTLEVLQFRDGAVVEVVNFSRSVFTYFDLPARVEIMESA